MDTEKFDRPRVLIFGRWVDKHHARVRSYQIYRHHKFKTSGSRGSPRTLGKVRSNRVPVIHFPGLLRTPNQRVTSSPRPSMKVGSNNMFLSLSRNSALKSCEICTGPKLSRRPPMKCPFPGRRPLSNTRISRQLRARECNELPAKDLVSFHCGSLDDLTTFDFWLPLLLPFGSIWRWQYGLQTVESLGGSRFWPSIKCTSSLPVLIRTTVSEGAVAASASASSDLYKNAYFLSIKC